MRLPGKRLIAGLLMSAAMGVAALSATGGIAQGQGAFRPSISVGPRVPTINPTFRTEPRFQRFNNDSDHVKVEDDSRPPKRPKVRDTAVGVAAGSGVVVGAAGAAGGGTPPPPGGGTTGPRGNINIPPPGEDRFVKDEVLLEFAPNVPPAGIAQLLVRRGLVQLETQTLTLTDTTVVRARIANRRSVRAVLQSLGGEAILRFGQPNYLYRAAQSQAPAALPETAAVTPAVATAAAIPAAGDPAQYVLGKLHLNEAHRFATGDKVLVAVIDSGVDVDHPDLAGAIAGSFDALGKNEKPHAHGTAIAGAIAAHARLMGAAPAAKILAIRAFGAQGDSAEATTMAVLKSVEYASLQRVRIINMSFAGPGDPGLGRLLAAAKARGAVLIAASGNFGPKSPPQYPAADPNVIAVSATDADDRIFKASNIGPHIAVTAPGVDILLPAPGKDYQITSGTSFSAAYVSGVAALVLQRAPALTPDGVREVLLKTAKDLGKPGKDPEFGAGLVDAYQAILAVQPPSASAQPAEVSQAAPSPQ